MIKIYTISSCTSCKKAKTWLNKHQLPYKEQNLGKEPLKKNRYAKALNCDIDELSVSEVIDLIQENPRILKSPILIDDKRLQVGYKEDDIRAFLPRSIRNVENSQARMRAAL
ncbi:transcriptional regulator Spx [Streptococcus thermophilus]|nr:transcriptional regulator Spx [Streptococcus thermophilus]MCE2237778.1 transcriptional regulator Spx [Streptococcus thermophilus]MCE2271804.1 transcriptional regulator Spx [Streptococcus thermophilus]